MTDYEAISRKAEADLNTYQSKTGNARPQGLDEAGVNSHAEKKFQDATVTTGDDLSTNRGYNKRIPPSEGVIDNRGRQTRSEHFEGKGGPLDKPAAARDQYGGHNDGDEVPANVGSGAAYTDSKDILKDGLQAKEANVGPNPPGPGGSKFKGEDYYEPESVPDSIAAEGNVPSDSVTQASRESKGIR